MRWLVWSVLTFALAAAVALAARFNHGNVALLWPPYRIDLSVNFALLLLAVLFVVLHLGLLGLGSALRLPARVRDYRERRLAQRQTAALQDAMLALFEGRPGRAERLAGLVQDTQFGAGLAALVAARAAHRLREFARSEQWLQRAEAQPGLRNAQLMTRAELAIERQEAAAALAAVDAMHQGGARHIQALRIALRAHEQAGDWPSVLRLVTQLEKRDAIEPAVGRQLRIDAYRALLQARSHDAAALRELWATVPPAERVHPDVAAAAADAFCTAQDTATAQRLLESALDAAWSDPLGERYAALAGCPVRDRLDRLEAWRVRHGDAPGLLRVLGEMCLSEQLWGKAQTVLEQSLATEPSAAGEFALACVYEATGRPEQAAAHYRASALLTVRGRHARIPPFAPFADPPSRRTRP